MAYEDYHVNADDVKLDGDPNIRRTVPPSPSGGFDPDNLNTSTNTPTDNDVIITKESSTWYVKAFSKVWDYIKGKIQDSSNEVAYGTCSTAAGTAAKVVTLNTASNWTLKKGTIVGIKFTNTNSFNVTADTAAITLNVNNTGAKNIYYANSSKPTGTNTTAFGRANYINYYMYDGTYWVWTGSSADNNTTYSNMTISELLTGTVTNQRTMRADYTKASIEALSTGYGTCDTAADVSAKVVTMNDPNWKLRVGARITVKFTNTNSASNCTLNVNNTGAKQVWYNAGVNTGNTNWLFGVANVSINYIYDGTYWVWQNINRMDNTTYSAMSKSELTTGTATTSRVVRADYLKSAILDLANPIGTIIESTTCDTMAKVVAAYGGTTWIQHSGYVLRGATSGVVSGTQGQTNDGGADSQTVSSVASHNHTQNAHYHPIHVIGSGSNWKYEVNGQWDGSGSGGNILSDYATATNIANGANYTVNTLPKYKNVYMWERTA